ncbi:MAG TPA: Hint domain-containing protein, partial [Paracoccaceae bacterium]
VRIAAGAFGRGLPRADLLVSPQHRMLMTAPGQEPVLIPAKALISRQGVRVMAGLRQVEYIHLIFDHHEVVFANGAASESFLPGKMALVALDQATRREVFEIFPRLR